MPSQRQRRAADGASASAAALSTATPRRALLWFGAVAVVTLALYARSWNAPLQFDDYIFLRSYEAGQFDTFAGFIGFARTRVIPVATLVANYRLGAESPWGYHAVNLAAHLLATFFVFRLALTICATPRLRGSWLGAQPLVFATAAALVFACHPIQVQSVTYIVQRASSLAGAFYVGSVLYYLRARLAQSDRETGRPLPAFAASVLLAMAAFASKENTASLPLAILLAEWAFFGAGRLGRLVLWLSPYVLLVLVIPLVWKVLGAGRGGSKVTGTPSEQVSGLIQMLLFRANPGGTVSIADYLLTQCTVIPSYFALLVLPWRLNVDHDVAIAHGFSGPVLAGLAFVAALLGGGIYAVRRWPVLGFAALWCLLGLSVESSILPLRDVMVEHRMYLAMPGVALAAAWGSAWLWQRAGAKAIAAAAAAGVALAGFTVQRNELWRDPVALWSDAVAKSPNRARTHVNLGTSLQLAGRLDEAITVYCRGLRLDPRNRAARSNLDAALEEQMDARLEADEGVSLEELNEAGGAVEGLAPIDPCTGR